jgi:hypothetical protein
MESHVANIQTGLSVIQNEYNTLKNKNAELANELNFLKARATDLEKEIARLNSLVDRSPDTLVPGQKLLPGHYLRSKNGAYFARQQDDGNFVVYQSSHFIG